MGERLKFLAIAIVMLVIFFACWFVIKDTEYHVENVMTEDDILVTTPDEDWIPCKTSPIIDGEEFADSVLFRWVDLIDTDTITTSRYFRINLIMTDTDTILSTLLWYDADSSKFTIVGE
jgi:hypothetical protein